MISTEISLRPYQSQCVDMLRAEFRDNRLAPLLVSPTGSGKTIIFSYMCAEVARRGRRVLILVHRDELLHQVASVLQSFDVPYGFISSNYYYDPRPLVHVGSVFTVAKRLDRLPAPDLIIIDEAHHAIGKSTWGRVLEEWPLTRRVGVTATPQRLSGEGLHECFDSMVLGPSVSTLIGIGSLSPYRIFAPTTVDVSGVHQRGGDYVQEELLRVMDQGTVLAGAVNYYRELCDGKRAVVFCVSIDHAEHTAEKFRESGYSASKIDGTMTIAHRRKLVERFRDGDIQVLTSCNIVSEGFDLPAIEAAILLRPTASLAVYLQQVGRVLRPHPGKSEAIILDHSGNVARHGFPDDEREWTLEGRRHKIKTTPTVAIRICPKCFAAVRPQPKCPFCDKEFEVNPREIDEVDGTLQEVNPALVRLQAKREQQSCRTQDELVALGRERGYKFPEQWAQHILRARHHIQQRRTG